MKALIAYRKNRRHKWRALYMPYKNKRQFKSFLARIAKTGLQVKIFYDF